ncbi:MAG: hypothetical protein Q9187_001850 [Circinaria calcarea]
MEDTLSGLSNNMGLGSWHPARRPDTDTTTMELDEQTRRNDTTSDIEAGKSHRRGSVSPTVAPATPLDLETLAPQTQSSHENLSQASPAKANTMEDGESKELLGLGIDTPPEASVSASHKSREVDKDMRKVAETIIVTTENSLMASSDEKLEDPFSILSRTTSFPEVPPLHKVENLCPVPPFAQSQFGDALDELQEAGSWDLGPNMQGGIQDPDPFGISTTGNEDSFFASVDSIGGHDISTPADEEARYEEGLPLVHHDLSDSSMLASDRSRFKEGVVHDPLEQLGMSDNDLLVNDNSEFSPEGSYFRPQPLDRKTTTQVLESMRYPPHNETHDTPKNSDTGSTLGDLPNGNTAASTNTVASQALVDEMKDETGIVPEQQLGASSTEDQDLAAMWQAALADDEFLEDEPIVDSTTFFDESGDEFLADDGQAQTDQFIPQQPSLPPSQPSFRSRGKMQSSEVFSSTGYRPVPDKNALQGHFYQPQEQNIAPPVSSPMQYASYGQQSPYAQGGGALTNTFQSSVGFNGAAQKSSYTTSGLMQRPGMPEKRESFVDKSKGGYTSPYDLPMDVTSRPKKRTNLQQLQNTNHILANIPPPPPRGSSMSSTVLSPIGSVNYLPPPANTPRSSLSPSAFSPTAPPLNTLTSSASTKPQSGTFFEELPLTIKPRSTSSLGRSVSQSPPTMPPPPQILPQRGHFPQSTYAPPPPETASSLAHQLLPPERISPYSHPAAPSPTTQSVPAVNSRYSPIPPSQPNVPLIRNRYDTAPTGPARPPSVTQILPFQPRTSSPLARSTSALQQHTLGSQKTGTGPPQSFPTESRRPSLRSFHTERPLPTNINDFNNLNPPLISAQSAGIVLGENDAPPRTLQYHHPLEQSQILSPDNHNFGAPGRSQTSTAIPDTHHGNRDLSESPRRASINHHTSSVNPIPYLIRHQITSGSAVRPERNPLPRINYLIPSDGREQDPLERWKGCPIFFFGFGGNIVTSFPKQVPRFAAGQKVPLTKCSPGEVRIRNDKLLPLDERVASFPGPLKSKSKKKDVLEWLSKGIEQLSQEYIPISPNQALEDSRKRHEEKTLMWKVLQTLVEYDNSIDGNAAAEKAVRNILSPEVVSGESSGQLSYESNLHLRRISRSNASKNTSSIEDPEALEGLRKHLLHGEREKAVWHAVDQRLWGHAMLISSTLSSDIWKKVIQEFVRHEVKTFGENTESIAALYDIFAGNWEDSIDELVPPSARAGLQMVSKNAGPGPTKNALDGLDKWRETLSLILSNRTPDDEKALIALGQLLARYERIEAAHVCYIFAKSTALLGGPNDAQASIVLLGADHLHQPFDYSRDLNSVLLTEIYEFALTALPPSANLTSMPHLQAHKLHHAMVLAEHGYREQAQQYCDAIQGALKATTKLSPYYHSLLFEAVEDLSARLKQVPRDGSASWITSASMDKVSGSLGSRFYQFVTGDASDASSTGSGKVLGSEAGPFSRVSGDTPAISRESSPNESYGPYVNGGVYAPGPLTFPAASSPYAPAGVYTPRSSLEQPSYLGQDSQKPAQVESFKRANLQKQPSYSSLPTRSPDLYRKQPLNTFQQVPRPASANIPPKSQRYSPTPPEGSYYKSEDHVRKSAEPQHQQISHGYPRSPSSQYSQNLIPPNNSTSDISNDPSTLSDESSSNIYQTPSDSYESRSAGQEPPLTSNLPRSAGYEPLPALSQPTSASYNEYPRSYEPSPTFSQSQATSYDPPSAALDTPTTSYGYEPPSTSSYNPPSYNPDTQSDDLSPVETKSKKKSFMDDDDEDSFAARAAAVLKAEKARNDREADEAFRKAAEADAQKDTRPGAPTAKSSWFGGWLGGGKSKDLSSKSSSSSQPRAVRANLGEASSFKYDPILKKWVNPKDGASNAATPTSTPPPPKGPPSRAVSVAGGTPASLGSIAGTGGFSPPQPPGSAVPSRDASPSLGSTLSPTTPSGEPRLTLSPPLPGASGPPSRPPSASPSAPPSRPSTGNGVAGSGGASIDDLLGVPAPRKGGTIKKGKKGRGYVDVMAK